MTKAAFLRNLRWRLRLELPGQWVKPLVEPMERFFREGEAAGKSETQLVAECADVRLAAAEILSAAAPDRVRFAALRLAVVMAVAVVWMGLFWRLPMLVWEYGLRGFLPAAVLLVAGLTMCYFVLGGKRLIRTRPEPRRQVLLWYGLNLTLVPGYITMFQFGIIDPYLQANTSGVWSGYATGIYRFLGGSIEQVGPSVSWLLYFCAALAGFFLLIAAARSMRVGGAYLPLVCVNMGVILACAQYLYMLRTLTDVASLLPNLLMICNTLCLTVGLALLVGLTVLLARRLQWSRN